MGPFEFKPGITGTAITVLLISLFVQLGMWQLGRMAEKQTLTQNLKHRTESDVIEFSDKEGQMINKDLESFRFHPLQITGSFLEEQDILLDNQIFQGRPGYLVITPFLSNDSNTLILVDRGWIPWGEDRNELPEIPNVPGTVTVTGIINQLPPGLQLAAQEPPMDLWPYRVQGIHYDELSKALKQPVFHFIVQLQKGSPYSFDIGPINFGLPADRHLGYAAQWFTMALAVFIYYLVINLRRL